MLDKFLFYPAGGIAAGFRSCQAVRMLLYDFVSKIEDTPHIGFTYL